VNRKVQGNQRALNQQTLHYLESWIIIL